MIKVRLDHVAQIPCRLSGVFNSVVCQPLSSLLKKVDKPRIVCVTNATAQNQSRVYVTVVELDHLRREQRAWWLKPLRPRNITQTR
jgi:hypothetical protein